MRIYQFLVIAIVLFAACKTPDIAVSDELQNNAEAMGVKGRQGLQFNQVVRYGGYTTSKVKRGWTKSREFSIAAGFVARFQKAEQKLSFTQITDEQRSGEVLAVNSFKNNEVDLLKGFLSLPFAYEDTYAGTIVPKDEGDEAWEFVIHNPDSSLPRDADCGLARNGTGDEILIRAVKKLEGRSAWGQLDNFGFEFLYRGKAIGAVSVINSGKVWIANDISPALKLVVSSLSTSLMLRHSLQEGFSN